MPFTTTPFWWSATVTVHATAPSPASGSILASGSAATRHTETMLTPRCCSTVCWLTTVSSTSSKILFSSTTASRVGRARLWHVTIKIVARNHQVLGVNNAVASVQRQEELKQEFPPERRLVSY